MALGWLKVFVIAVSILVPVYCLYATFTESTTVINDNEKTLTDITQVFYQMCDEYTPYCTDENAQEFRPVTDFAGIETCDDLLRTCKVVKEKHLRIIV